MKNKKKHTLTLVLVTILLAVVTCAAVIGAAACYDYGLYTRSYSSIIEDQYKNLLKKYSVYAMSDYYDDFNMEELKNSNFRYGVIHNSGLDGLDLTDMNNYVVQNFDENFNPETCNLYSCYAVQKTEFVYDLTNPYSFDYVSTEVRSVQNEKRLSGAVYNWNTGKLYFVADSDLYEFHGTVEYSQVWGTGNISTEDSSFRTVMNQMLTGDRSAWLDTLYDSYFTFNEVKCINLSNIWVVDNQTIDDYGKIMDSSVSEFDGDYIVIYEAEDLSNDSYYLLSYVANPINEDSDDLFANPTFRLIKILYDMRYVIIIAGGIIGLITLVLMVILLKRFIRFLFDAWRSDVNTIIRTILVLAVVSFAELFLIMCWGGDALEIAFLWFLEKLVLYPIILAATTQVSRIQKDSAVILKEGNGGRVDTKHMLWDYKKIGENINSMSEGIDAAIEARIKSEHMRTELITNVSHDIKTPLTSIVSYVDLLQKEGADSENAAEYLEVLARQSERLKKLIEDLIEASKASTGNLTVEKQEIDLNVVLEQLLGEYQEKLNQKQITLLTKTPGEEVTISADPQHLQRVFDNLLGNITKYAQPGTRAYVNLETKAFEGVASAVITFRNTSSSELNITADELKGRFVRGEESRQGDGHGLGLSIADSLTELMGGKMNLYIDGDLFKVELIFPVCAK